MTVGGAIGSVVRYLAGAAVAAISGVSATVTVPAGSAGGGPSAAFPWPVFAVNVSGCLVLGVTIVYLLEVWPPSQAVRLFLTTGLLGGYTTFSTFTSGVLALAAGRFFALADAYALSSLVAGVAAVWCGAALARRAARTLASKAGLG